MVRIFLIIVCFLIYGNFNYVIDSFVIFTLINLTFYSFLKEKNLKLFDFIIFISTSYQIEIFLGLPLFISVVALSIPLLLLSSIINNFFVHFSIISLFIFYIKFNYTLFSTAREFYNNEIWRLFSVFITFYFLGYRYEIRWKRTRLVKIV